MRLETKNRIAAFTLAEIMIVVAIIALLASIALPSYVRARARGQITTCLANLKQVEGAMDTWAMDKRKKEGESIEMTDLVPDYMKLEPKCPAGQSPYKLGHVGHQPTCPNFDESDSDLRQHSLRNVD